VRVDREGGTAAGEQEHAGGGLLPDSFEAHEIPARLRERHAPQDLQAQAPLIGPDASQDLLDDAALGACQSAHPDRLLEGGAVRLEDLVPGREAPAQGGVGAIAVPAVRALRQDGEDQLVEGRVPAADSRPAMRLAINTETENSRCIMVKKLAETRRR